MEIVEFSRPLQWGLLDLPLWPLDRDWRGQRDQPCAFFSLALDPVSLWFIAGDRQPARSHPQSQSGQWCEELWHHDVAEFFLGLNGAAHYLEFNLAPNAAWWQQSFCQTRTAQTDSSPLSGIETFAELAPDNSWLAAMKIPRVALEALLSRDKTALTWKGDVTANVCFILRSPQQRFYSFNRLPGEQPDFHQPQFFSPLRLLPST